VSKRASVLIVDDDIGMCETTSDVLSAWGYRVEFAENGFKAVEKAREIEFDVILMDIKMEGMNGVETYKEIKRIIPKTSVIMMTAYSVEELVREALEEGASTVLYKPIDMGELIRLIELVRGEHPSW